MTKKVKKIAFYVSFSLSVLIALVKCDRGLPTENVERFSISGTITLQGDSIESIEIKLEGDYSSSGLTDSLGAYVFTDLAEGLYAVYPVSSGYDFNPQKRQVELASMDLEEQNFSMGEAAPILLLLEKELDFGKVPVGSNRQLRLGIGNLGRVDLVVSNIAFDDNSFSSSPTELTVPPDSLEYITVIFTPNDSAAITAEMTLTTNDTEQPKAIVSLSGEGIAGEKPKISLEPPQLNFGFARLGVTSTLNLIVSNTGGDTLKISSITAANPLFQVSTDSAAIPAGENLTVRVSFTPQETATVTATLNITNNSENRPDAKVPLSGGSGGQSLPSSIEVNKTELDFGEVYADSQAVEEVQISSVGSQSLLLTAIEVNNNVFSVPFAVATLAPGETRSYPVSFQVSARGLYQGTMTVYSNDPENTAVQVSLRAETITPPPTELRFNPTQISFGEILVGNEGISSFWVINPSGFPLIVSSIRSTSPDDFRVDTESLTVNPGDSAQITVTFSPRSAQEYNEMAVLSTNVIGGDTVSVSLSGEGTQAPSPEMELSSTSIDFGSVLVQTETPASLTVGNNGPGTLLISSMEIDNSDFMVTAFTGAINTETSRTIQLSFEPGNAGESTGTLVIESNDPVQGRAEIALRGNAIDASSQAPIMVLSTHSLDLGRMLLQTTGSSSFIINNIGKEELVVLSISSNNAAFSVDQQQVIVQPGMKQTIGITFSPVGEGISQGLILIESNDLINPFDSIRVQAEAVSRAGVASEGMVYIAGGSFMMGAGSSEIVRQVVLSGFFMDIYEVTNAQYKEFLDAGGYSNSDYWTSEGWLWRQTSGETKPLSWGSGDAPWESFPYSNTPDSPVVGVNWYEAYAYARFREKTLPTEAQWEYAARGEEGRIYPWGNTWFADLLNHGKSRSMYYDESDGFKYAAPVGSFPLGAVQEPENIYDLAGNVFEWCLDWYAQYDRQDVFNPQGPAVGEKRVIRGGSWRGSVEYCSAFHRNLSVPQLRYINGGIRLVRNF